jgi:hypothetical protein
LALGWSDIGPIVFAGCDFGEPLGVAHDHLMLAAVEKAAPPEVGQGMGRRFARRPDHLREFLLGQASLDQRAANGGDAEALGEVDELAGESLAHPLVRHGLELAFRLLEAAREERDDIDRDDRVANGRGMNSHDAGGRNCRVRAARRAHSTGAFRRPRASGPIWHPVNPCP